MTDDTNPAVPLIAGFEGFRANPYWDVNHHRVGYGSDTITKADGTVVSVQPGMSVTQEDAQRDLNRRVGQYQSQIQDTIGPDKWSKLSPAAQASLTSVAYNYGHLPYGVQDAAASGDHSRIAAAIAGLSGDNNGVNAKRRQTEANNVLGIGGAGGGFGLGGVTPATSSTASTPSASPSLALLQGVLGKNANPVPQFKPNDPNGPIPQSKLEALIRTAAGQGTYTPGFVSKLQGLGGSLNSLFGGSTTGPGSPPGPAAPQLASAPPIASPATAAPLPAPVGSASAGEGGTNPAGDVPLPPPRPADLTPDAGAAPTPVADASSDTGLGGLLGRLFG